MDKIVIYESMLATITFNLIAFGIGLGIFIRYFFPSVDSVIAMLPGFIVGIILFVNDYKKGKWEVK